MLPDYAKQLLDDLTEYTGRDRNLVLLRCEGAGAELAWQWPHYAHNPLEFYRSTDLYNFDLTADHLRLCAAGAYEWFNKVAKKLRWQTMLDYGGGMGQWTILAAKQGILVDFVEVAESKTLAYAKWRFERHDVARVFIFPENTPITGDYDLIVLMDVLEHLPNPEELIKQAWEHCAWILANPNEIKYNFLYPQHISHYSLEPYFEHLDAYLWKRAECPLKRSGDYAPAIRGARWSGAEAEKR